MAAEKPRIGLINPQPYMTKYLEEIKKDWDMVILSPDETDFSPECMKKWAQFARDKGLKCVVGLAQKDSWHHCLINRELGNVSISALAYLIAMNKFMQRTIEVHPFWFEPCDPMIETDEVLAAKVTNAKEWPCMLKNTSLSLGRGVFRIKTPEDMKAVLKEYREDADLQAKIKGTNDAITQYFTPNDEKYLQAPPINGNVPPFLFEHCVDLTLGWIEYCYEGLITEEGKLVHYGFTEEFYSKAGAGLAYVTPPPSYKKDPVMIKRLEAYIEEYMAGLITRGYLRQFFNVEIWARYFKNDKGEEDVEFCWCEINPRCAHAYHIPYQIAYGTSLWKDNFELVLNNKVPDNSPWQAWKDGKYKVSVQVLINVNGSAGKKVGEVLDYGFVDHIESKNKVDLVRHVKQRDYVLTDADAASGAGCTLLQIFKACSSHEEAAAYEVAIRDLVYLIPQGDEYPEWWIELSAKGGVDKCKAALKAD